MKRGEPLLSLGTFLLDDPSESADLAIHFLDSLWHGDRLGQERVLSTPKSCGWGRKLKITTPAILIDIYDGDLILDGSASFSLENANCEKTRGLRYIYQTSSISVGSFIDSHLHV
jgi:hypothetical protein